MKEIDFVKVEAIVKEAGKMMLQANASEEIVHEKAGAANFCTEYDLKIQRFLIAKLKEVLPEATYYGEEDTEGSAQEVRSDYVFYIDPIDGTTNFMLGYHHSCVSVGLAYQNKIIAGFVYNPYVDEMYVGIRGKGSTLNGRKLWLENKTISEGIAGFDATRYNEGVGEVIDILFMTVKELYCRSLATREGGSSTLDLCRVASAGNVVYVQFVLKPYDYAAAMVIVEEAGGVMTQMDGLPLCLDRNCSMICGTPAAWAEAKQIVEESTQKVQGKHK